MPDNKQSACYVACTHVSSPTHYKSYLSLHRFVEEHHLGEVLFASIDVQLNEENIYQRDILFVAQHRLDIIGNRVYGAPDLIVEVLSKGSERLDKVEKKAVYEQVGVQEYWIVDPVSKEPTGYKLCEGKYSLLPSKPGEIRSDLLQTTIQF